MPSDGKKGITVKIDAELHAEVRQYVEQHEMTMAEFVALALTDELHPKFNQIEGQNMGNMRTLAFQVPEALFQQIKDYLQRNNMTQKEFVIGLIEDELRREQTERNAVSEAAESPEDESTPEETAAESDFETISKEAENYAGEQAENDYSGGFEDEHNEFESENACERYDEDEEFEDDSEDEDEEESETEGLGISMGM